MNICVYGAASNTIDAAYLQFGEALGQKMAKRGHTLIFGGGTNGMMGAVARGVHSEGGEIVGVAPTFFPDGAFFPHCTAFHSTTTMRERKQKMEELSDAFLVTPGGIGTYEEFFEIFTLCHLGRLKKKIVICNRGGYFDPLLALLSHTVREGFLAEADLGLLFVSDDADEILDRIEADEEQ